MAYKILFFLLIKPESGELVKEIGERFREMRENIGIELEEAASDLKVPKEDLKNIEIGNIKAFENVVTLKEFISTYSRYLGLDVEEMLDEYNEYLFDQTSKISLADIKAAKRKLAKTEKKEKPFRSPYTNFKKENKKYHCFILAFLLVLFITVGCLFVYMDGKQKSRKEITNVAR